MVLGTHFTEPPTTRVTSLDVPRNLGGIPAITFSDSAIEPVMKVMKVADLSLCILDLEI